MHTVAVNAGGYIWVAFPDESRPVGAGLIFLIDGAVALGTGVRNPDTRFWCELFGARIN